jgi:ribosome-associated toxin RatA of RatAB toxin-antitoxin module
MASAVQSIEVDVPPEKFFSVVQDYPRYPEFLPEVKSVRMGPRRGNSVEVTYRLDVKLKVIEYSLTHIETPPGTIAWHLIKGEFMKGNEGSWSIAATPSGCRATYSIELNLGALVPASLEKALAEQGLPNMLRNFKARAEKLYRPTSRP